MYMLPVIAFKEDDQTNNKILHIFNYYCTGLKLHQRSREKSLLPQAELGRSELLAGRSEILNVAETCLDLPCQLSLYCL